MYVFDTFVKITCWDCVVLLLDTLFHSINLHVHLCQFDSGFVSMLLEVNFYSIGLLSRSRFQNNYSENSALIIWPLSVRMNIGPSHRSLLRWGRYAPSVSCFWIGCLVGWFALLFLVCCNKGILSFDKGLFNICWDDCMIVVFGSVYVTCCAYWWDGPCIPGIKSACHRVWFSFVYCYMCVMRACF